MILIGNKREDEILNLAGKRMGSIVAYFGYVREFAHGKTVHGMTAEKTQETEKIMKKIENEIRTKFPIENVVLYHSVGDLRVGDLLAAVVISSVHRKEGFEACRYGIDRIKELEPVRRKEF